LVAGGTISDISGSASNSFLAVSSPNSISFLFYGRFLKLPFGKTNLKLSKETEALSEM
jgi:hypothetical protein